MCSKFQEDATIIRTPLPIPRTCHYCSARLFHHETFEMCCNGGKVSRPRVNAPQELLEIFLDPSTEGNHFRKHIRGYNHVFFFTSCGVHIDEQLAITGRGIYISCSRLNISQYRGILSRSGNAATFFATVHI